MMKTRSTTALTSVALLCGLCMFPPACAQSLDERCAEGACDPRDGATVDVADGGTDAPTDPCVNNPSDPKCLDESTALFVSGSTGDDKAPGGGTRAKPLKTITAALSKIDATKRRIYICDGTYAEGVTVTTSVSLLGGLACDWAGKGTNPRIAPTKGIGLRIVKASSVAVTDIDVEAAADSQVAGDSAIAVFASQSNGLLLRRVNLTAGPGTNGGPGKDGELAPNYVGAIATGGQSTSTGAAGPAPACVTCADGSLSAGGAGAAAGGFPMAGAATPPAGSDNSGGTLGGVCSDGKVGAPGAAGAAALGSPQPGLLSLAGWQADTGAKKGPNGNPGQGGGGGGSTSALGGGSGGCGGCGGRGGGPGTNGGSSFALLSFESDVAVENGKLVSAKGGIGGKGGKGQDGQLRGTNGGGACLGGTGGQGAGGGGGGGGAGGHSAPIAHSRKAPTTMDTTMTPAAAGDQGLGGQPGAGPGTAGSAGVSGAKASSVEVLAL